MKWGILDDSSFAVHAFLAGKRTLHRSALIVHNCALIDHWGKLTGFWQRRENKSGNNLLISPSDFGKKCARQRVDEP